jgi:capsular exopolysaccharide synthesis family protein
MQKAHRLLRGRYGLAITLGLLGATVGGLAGWFSQSPEQRSDAMIEIQPILRSLTDSDKVMPFYTQFLASQPYHVTRPQVIQAAMESPEWKKVGWDMSGDGVQKFRECLYAEAIKNTQTLHIAFTHPDAATAQAGTRAVVAAYTNLFDQMNGTRLAKEISALDALRESTLTQIRTMGQQIDNLSKQYGSRDLSVRHNEMSKRLVYLDTRLSEERIVLESVEDQLKLRKATTNPTQQLAPEEIAGLDNGYIRPYLQKLDTLRMDLERTRSRFGEQHPSVLAIQTDIDLTSEWIRIYSENFNKEFTGTPVMTNAGVAVPLNERSLTQLRARYENLKQLSDEQAAETTKVGEVWSQIQSLQSEIANRREDLLVLERRYDERLAQAAATGTLSIINPGDVPVEASDKRKQMAFVGFAGGAALPIGLLLLIGLLDHRYRFSEEATTDMSGITLLGILPNLPDRLTDPDQAATAAHCVHQIRTMLQINCQSDDCNVYCVTSAAPGDGKTSLTLALGLSFAASGSRTLLIDCDLVGGGLTARLDMAGPEGVLEALTTRQLMQHVRQTDIADLAILPVGMAQAHHAGLFSPAAVRRLVHEAKKHFEVVLIDTGPILGSIEATPVAAASDAVILTVARGQQRPLVEKALGHLLGIGARFAGVVFNRAQSRDFEQSISGMSLRSIARTSHTNGNGGATKAETRTSKAFGPVARAVATSTHSADER